MVQTLKSAKASDGVKKYQARQAQSPKYSKQVTIQQKYHQELQTILQKIQTANFQHKLKTHHLELSEKISSMISTEEESFKKLFMMTAWSLLKGSLKTLDKILKYLINNPAALMMILTAMYADKARAGCEPVVFLAHDHSSFVLDIDRKDSKNMTNVAPYMLQPGKTITSKPTNITDQQICMYAQVMSGSLIGSPFQMTEIGPKASRYGFRLKNLGNSTASEAGIQVQTVVKPYNLTEYLEPYNGILPKNKGVKLCFSHDQNKISFILNGKEIKSLPSSNEIVLIEAYSNDKMKYDQGKEPKVMLIDCCIEKIEKLKPEIANDPVKKNKAINALIAAGSAGAFVMVGGAVAYLILKHRKKSRILPIPLDEKKLPPAVQLSDEKQGILSKEQSQSDQF